MILGTGSRLDTHIVLCVCIDWYSHLDRLVVYLSVKVTYPWVQKFHSHELHKDVYCIVYKLQKYGSSVPLQCFRGTSNKNTCYLHVAKSDNQFSELTQYNSLAAVDQSLLEAHGLFFASAFLILLHFLDLQILECPRAQSPVLLYTIFQ